MTDISTLAGRKELGDYYAKMYLLDPALVCAVVEHESSWNPFAIRYEPAFFDKYEADMQNVGKTERQARAFSWGLMQVMGQTAREFGFSEMFLSGLTDPNTGVDFGCRKLRRCLDRHDNDEHAALLSYNGGNDLTYPDAVQKLKPKYY